VSTNRGFLRSRFALLLLGVALAGTVWFGFWYSRLQAFEAAVAGWSRADHPSFVLTHQGVSFSGFPYRLEAAFTNATLTRSRADYSVSLRADRLTIIEQPWKQDFAVAFAEQAEMMLLAPSPVKLSGVPPLTIRAPDLQASLRVAPDGRVERLSLVWKKAIVDAPGYGLTGLTADDLQMHGRETPPAPRPATDPRQPLVLQGVISARKLGRAKLVADTLSMDIDISGSDLSRLAAWGKTGGSAEIRRFELVGGKVKATGTASLAVDGSLTLTGAGTVTTNDPDAVRSFLADGQLLPSRLKVPDQKLALTLQDGTLIAR
jgi:hypothetical protein